AIRTNHYAADLVGLIVVGALFPELRRWFDVFAPRLWEEIPRQCRADGTHFESSTGYHRLCAELFLVAALAARAGGRPAPDRVERAVRGLFRSLAATLKPSGEMPQIGDLDSCRALPLAPRLALDASFAVDANAREPRERNERRGTAAHNTVQVDGREQNRIVPGRLFALPDTARARITAMDPRDGFELAAGEHRGYERSGVVHRRVAALRGDCAAFVDELRGHGEHLFQARWHVPHQDVVQRRATAEEQERFAALQRSGLSFGYDLERCLEVAGKALFAFGATLPWTISLLPTDVSPGY